MRKKCHEIVHAVRRRADILNVSPAPQLQRAAVNIRAQPEPLQSISRRTSAAPRSAPSCQPLAPTSSLRLSQHSPIESAMHAQNEYPNITSEEGLILSPSELNNNVFQENRNSSLGNHQNLQETNILGQHPNINHPRAVPEATNHQFDNKNQIWLGKNGKQLQLPNLTHDAKARRRHHRINLRREKKFRRRCSTIAPSSRFLATPELTRRKLRNGNEVTADIQVPRQIDQRERNRDYCSKPFTQSTRIPITNHVENTSQPKKPSLIQSSRKEKSAVPQNRSFRILGGENVDPNILPHGDDTSIRLNTLHRHQTWKAEAPSGAILMRQNRAKVADVSTERHMFSDLQDHFRRHQRDIHRFLEEERQLISDAFGRYAVALPNFFCTFTRNDLNGILKGRSVADLKTIERHLHHLRKLYHKWPKRWQETCAPIIIGDTVLQTGLKNAENQCDRSGGQGSTSEQATDPVLMKPDSLSHSRMKSFERGNTQTRVHLGDLISKSNIYNTGHDQDTPANDEKQGNTTSILENGEKTESPSSPLVPKKKENANLDMAVPLLVDFNTLFFNSSSVTPDLEHARAEMNNECNVGVEANYDDFENFLVFSSFENSICRTYSEKRTANEISDATERIKRSKTAR